jgi:hypothetical protein
MAGNEKDHWLRNTRANDTGSIVDVSLGLFNLWLRGDLYGCLPELLNLFSLVRLRTSPYPRRHGVTITGLLVTVYPAGHSGTHAGTDGTHLSFRHSDQNLLQQGMQVYMVWNSLGSGHHIHNTHLAPVMVHLAELVLQVKIYVYLTCAAEQWTCVVYILLVQI